MEHAKGTHIFAKHVSLLNDDLRKQLWELDLSFVGAKGNIVHVHFNLVDDAEKEQEAIALMEKYGYFLLNQKEHDQKVQIMTRGPEAGANLLIYRNAEIIPSELALQICEYKHPTKKLLEGSYGVIWKTCYINDPGRWAMILSLLDNSKIGYVTL